jgi:hypothetical protein
MNECENYSKTASFQKQIDALNGVTTSDHSENYKQLLIALHDAINRPKGVVPSSADEFYCQDYYKNKTGD